MKLTLSSILIAVLLSIASSSLACASRPISVTDANGSARSVGGDESLPAGWKRYDFQKPLAFSLLLPGEPEQRITPLLDGAALSHVFISAGNSGVYGATYISDLPAVARLWESTGSKLLYEMFIKDFAVKLAGKGGEQGAGFDSKIRFTTELPVTVSGLKGLEREFSIEDFRGRMRLVSVGPAGFCLVAIWKQTAPPAELDAFFNSVRVAAD